MKQLLTKYQIFTKLPQISHIHTNHYFLDQLFLPYKFYGREMQDMYFFIFASCKPLNYHSDTSSLISKGKET